MFFSSISDTSGFTMPSTSSYLANPPVAPGENTQLLAQTTTIISDWAATRTFTPFPWEGAVYTPQGQQPLSEREKAAFEWQCQDQMNWYNNEFIYHKLGPESGLPEVRMVYKGPIRYYVGTLEKEKDRASFTAGACNASGNVLRNLRTASGDATAVDPPNHPVNIIYTYVRDGIDAIDTTTITHYADLAAAEAAGNIRYDTYIYIESTKEVWYRTYKNYWAIVLLWEVSKGARLRAKVRKELFLLIGCKPTEGDAAAWRDLLKKHLKETQEFCDNNMLDEPVINHPEIINAASRRPLIAARVP